MSGLCIYSTYTFIDTIERQEFALDRGFVLPCLLSSNRSLMTPDTNRDQQSASALSPVTLAVLLMLASTVLLASMHGMVRAVSADLHPFVIVFFRNVFGLIAVLPLLARHGLSSLSTQKPGLHALRAGIGMLAMLSWFYALSKVPITHATALSFSTTIFATLAAWLFLKETLRIRRWLAIITGMLGVLVVLQPSAEHFNLWSLLPLGAALVWGTSVTIVKKLTATDSTLTIVAWMSITLTVLSLVPALFYWQTPNTEQLLWLAAIGALATAGHLLMTRSLKLADVSIVMSIDFSRLVWTSIIGIAFFAETPGINTVIGAVIIFLAGWYIIFRESRIKSEHTPPEKGQ